MILPAPPDDQHIQFHLIEGLFEVYRHFTIEQTGEWSVGIYCQTVFLLDGAAITEEQANELCAAALARGVS